MTHKHSICGPIGGFTQHIRWLMLVSANYNDLEKLNYIGAMVPKKYYPFKGEDKVKFIQEHIYPSDRRCFNWLDEKYMHRQALKKVILHTHELDECGSEPTIIITMDPMFSYNFYLKFAPMIALDKDGFIEKVVRQNKENLDYANAQPNCFHIDTEQLYSPTLDRNIYDNMISFLNIDNVYECAQQVHKMWYDNRKSAEEEIVAFIDNSEFLLLPFLS